MIVLRIFLEPLSVYKEPKLSNGIVRDVRRLHNFRLRKKTFQISIVIFNSFKTPPLFDLDVF